MSRDGREGDSGKYYNGYNGGRPRSRRDASLIIGKAQSSEISAARRDPFHAYIGNLCNDVTVDMMKSFLTCIVIEVGDVECLSGENSTNKAFPVTVQQDEFNKLVNEYL